MDINKLYIKDNHRNLRYDTLMYRRKYWYDKKVGRVKKEITGHLRDYIFMIASSNSIKYITIENPNRINYISQIKL